MGIYVFMVCIFVIAVSVSGGAHTMYTTIAEGAINSISTNKDSSQVVVAGRNGTISCIISASSVSGHPLDTQTLKNHPSEHPNSFLRNFSK